jgi:glutamine synthetase
VALTHPGYQLLGEDHADQADAVLRLVQSTVQGLGLPLRSLEIELGPSQFEAVFGVMDALAAADAMVLFRHAVKQALRRAGYHATFICRPPFANVMASGWHLHHSLVDAEGSNAFTRAAAAPVAGPLDARQVLSDTGAHWLAGLLAHAPAMAALVAPTVNAYGRFKPNALAPLAARWGRDNRGAMLRVIGQAGDPATRIENRLGEPAANPYLTMAAHAIAGNAGLRGALPAPQATEAPYAPVDAANERLPTTLAEALDALQADAAFREGLGDDVLEWYTHLKRFEISRHDAAEDRAEWERRVYFARL